MRDEELQRQREAAAEERQRQEREKQQQIKEEQVELSCLELHILRHLLTIYFQSFLGFFIAGIATEAA